MLTIISKAQTGLARYLRLFWSPDCDQGACRTVKPKSVSLIASAGAFSTLIAATPAHALVDEGVTYNLIETPLSPTTAQFELEISGINGPSDAEGGRSGVAAFAFNPPKGFVSGTSPGFTEMPGGLNSGGCDGSGNFFCFEANTIPPSTPALPANSTLDIFFDLTISSSGNFSEFGPVGQDDSFKIEWVGSQNHYDLVSEDLPAVVAPAPVIGHGLPVLLAVSGVLFGAKLLERSKKHRSLRTDSSHAA
jgi:hypothetical protein